MEVGCIMVILIHELLQDYASTTHRMMYHKGSLPVRSLLCGKASGVKRTWKCTCFMTDSAGVGTTDVEFTKDIYNRCDALDYILKVMSKKHGVRMGAAGVAGQGDASAH